MSTDQRLAEKITMALYATEKFASVLKHEGLSSWATRFDEISAVLRVGDTQVQFGFTNSRSMVEWVA